MLASFSLSFMVTDAPEVSITSGSGRVEVTEGEDLRLSCRLVGGDRDSRIAWALK